jgi:hypothetical protein
MHYFQWNLIKNHGLIFNYHRKKIHNFMDLMDTILRFLLIKLFTKMMLIFNQREWFMKLIDKKQNNYSNVKNIKKQSKYIKTQLIS